MLACAVNAQSGGKAKKPLKDAPLKIKSRIQPNENILLECNFRLPAQLYIGVLATFDKSGKVTDAQLDSRSGCREFDDEVLRVAKKIKFKPAVSNGVPVTVTAPLTYIVSARQVNNRRF